MSAQADQAIRVTFPAGLYSLNAIKKAAYRVLDRATVDILPSPSAVECVLHVATTIAPTETDAVVRDFKAEVLDQDLRESIAAETAPVRNATLAFAFSKTRLQGD